MLSSAWTNGERDSWRPPIHQRPAASLRRLAVLDLEDEKAKVGVSDDEVGLAVVGRATRFRRTHPLDVRVEVVLGREGGPQPVVDEALGVAAATHWRMTTSARVVSRARSGRSRSETRSVRTDSGMGSPSVVSSIGAGVVDGHVLAP